MFLDVKQCEGGCNHRYKREEEFYGLSLSVTTGNLVDSLRLFVQEEVLEGARSGNALSDYCALKLLHEAQFSLNSKCTRV